MSFNTRQVELGGNIIGFQEGIGWEVFKILADNPSGLTSQEILEEADKKGIIIQNPAIHISNLKQKLRDLGSISNANLHTGRPALYRLNGEVEMVGDKTEVSQELVEEEIISTPQNDWIKDHPRMKTFLESLSGEETELLEEFLESDTSHFTKKIKDLESMNKGQAKDLRMRMVGAIFEQMGYLHFSKMYEDQPSFMVLSPREVFELYKSIFPTRKPIENDELNFGIKGVVVPDGLILRETSSSFVVDSIIEYKMWAKRAHLKGYYNQRKNYSYDLFVENFFRNNSTGVLHNRAVRKVRPEMSEKPFSVYPNTKIVYAIPENSQVIFPDDVQVEKIPLSSISFGSFIDTLIEVVQDKGSEDKAALEESEDVERAEAVSIDTLAEEILGPELSSDAWEIEDVYEETKNRINEYLDKLAKAPNRITLGQYASYFKPIKKQEVNLAIAAHLIRPQIVRGNPRLTHEEAAILAYWLQNVNGNIEQAYMDGLRSIAAEEWEKRRADNT